MRLLQYRPQLDMRHVKKETYRNWSNDINETLCRVAKDILDDIPRNTECKNVTAFGSDGYKHAFVYENHGQLFSLSILWTDNNLDNVIVELFFTRDTRSVLDYYRTKKELA